MVHASLATFPLSRLSTVYFSSFLSTTFDTFITTCSAQALIHMYQDPEEVGEEFTKLGITLRFDNRTNPKREPKNHEKDAVVASNRQRIPLVAGLLV